MGKTHLLMNHVDKDVLYLYLVFKDKEATTNLMVDREGKQQPV